MLQHHFLAFHQHCQQSHYDPSEMQTYINDTTAEDLLADMNLEDTILINKQQIIVEYGIHSAIQYMPSGVFIDLLTKLPTSSLASLMLKPRKVFSENKTALELLIKRYSGRVLHMLVERLSPQFISKELTRRTGKNSIILSKLVAKEDFILLGKIAAKIGNEALERAWLAHHAVVKAYKLNLPLLLASKSHEEITALLNSISPTILFDVFVENPKWDYRYLFTRVAKNPNLTLLEKNTLFYNQLMNFILFAPLYRYFRDSSIDNPKTTLHCQKEQESWQILINQLVNAPIEEMKKVLETHLTIKPFFGKKQQKKFIRIFPLMTKYSMICNRLAEYIHSELVTNKVVATALHLYQHYLAWACKYTRGSEKAFATALYYQLRQALLSAIKAKVQQKVAFTNTPEITKKQQMTPLVMLPRTVNLLPAHDASYYPTALSKV